ncbi:MAG: ethylbenzene dehydrogenase-related protein [Planctomycetota bacterium]|jgi:hypothetical protein
MRRLLVPLLVLAACGEEPPPPVQPARQDVLTVRSFRLPQEIERIKIDGNGADAGWRHARARTIPLSGQGPKDVTIKAAHNAEYFYFLLIWRDEKVDLNNVCRFEKPGKWKMHEGEDALLFLFPPAELASGFRKSGLPLFVDGGEFKHPGTKGFADVWYWGAQTTRPFWRARDHWLQPNGRLRGDAQPDNSDNVMNWSVEWDGPAAVPAKITSRATWYLRTSNSQTLTPEKMARMSNESNFGWTVSAVIHRPFAGSRADVAVKSRWSNGAWVAEMARKLETGNRDDLVHAGSMLFALAVYDGTGKGVRVGEYGLNAAISEPIEVTLSDS